MSKNRYIFLIACLICLCSEILLSQEVNVRISWDRNSYQELTSYLVPEISTTLRTAYYPRIKRLGNGSLLMVFMNAQYGYNIYTRKSYDDAKTWSDASLVRKQYNEASPTSTTDKVVFACPDFIEFEDGEILLAYQWRYNSAYSSVTYTNISCGIEVMRSYDYGETWETPVKMYFGRNWEPSFIKLPSGELQMLFTDSHEVTEAGKSRPCVSMLRSFDKGISWQGKEVCSYEDAIVLSRIVDSNGTYDGMPVGKYLANNNGIAYACESWGIDQTPWIVHSSVENNWIYNDFDYATGGPGPDRRWLLHENFKGHAPYMEVLPTGDVVVLSNGQYNGVSGIWTFLGQENAKNFSYASSPFSGWWGSIAYIGSNEVISVANYDYNIGSLSYEGLKIMKGKLNYLKSVNKVSPVLQSLSSFDRNMNDDWFIGEKSTSYAYVNFGYTNTGFDYTVHLFDSIITAFTPANADAVVLRLNRTNIVTSQSISYQMCVNALGDFSLDEKSQYIWNVKDVSSVTDITVNLEGTVNVLSDVDLGYAVKVCVPWDLLGGYPSENDVFRAHLRLRYKDVVTESPMASVASLAGENPDDNSTWLKIIFNDIGTNVKDIISSGDSNIYIFRDIVYVNEPDKVEYLNIYNMLGMKILDVFPVVAQNQLIIPDGFYILKYKYLKDNFYRSKKFFLK